MGSGEPERVRASETPEGGGPGARVTVVIPTRNRADLLRQAIESVLAQAYRPMVPVLCPWLVTFMHCIPAYSLFRRDALLESGGWQTIVLGALDERVRVAVEVAGFGALPSNIASPIDTDEVEEDATDLTAGQDYTHLVALRAPRPTLLIHNAEDTCCFRAALVKPYIYGDVKPFFRLYGKEDALAWHENTDPGTHNYQIDNRQAAYRFFSTHFGMPLAEHEIPSGSEIKTPDELAVGVPGSALGGRLALGRLRPGPTRGHDQRRQQPTK